MKTKLKKKINIYCITNKSLNYLEDLPFILIGVGESHFNNSYTVPDNLDNIYFKEKYYSELTYHYWFWKYELKNFDNKSKKSTKEK